MIICSRSVLSAGVLVCQLVKHSHARSDRASGAAPASCCWGSRTWTITTSSSSCSSSHASSSSSSSS